MSLDIDRIGALCFDLDGTLSDTDDLWVHKLEPLFRPFPFLHPHSDLHTFTRRVVMGLETPGNLLYHWFDRFSIDYVLGRVYSTLIHLHLIRRRQRKFWAITGAVEMIRTLCTRYPLALVTTRDAYSTDCFLKQFDIHHCFTAVATSQTCFYTKPFPDPVLWAARQMGVPAQNCLMIGDTVVDIRAGRAAGTQTVGVLCGFGSEDELRRAKADEILSATPDLLNIL